MAAHALPDPKLTLEPAQARRFLLLHQRLLPPRAIAGEAGVVELLRHLGCIQYDPIDIVGRNPDLVLQSRVAGYSPEILERLLHVDHEALMIWDKMAAIGLREDWPSFARRRALMAREHGRPETPEMQVAPFVLEEIRKRGPLSSRDIEHEATVDWWWGRKKRLVGASLEILLAMGVVLVHHRVRSERYFDLAGRILPPALLRTADPHPRDEDYEDWHVERRVRSLGLAPATGAPEYWWGIVGVKGTAPRARVLTRLAERGAVLPVSIEGATKRRFFVRAADLPTLEAAGGAMRRHPQASFLAPLDNAVWDRDLVRELFNFDYCWEIYKPKAKRLYGYYVLPVLYGDRFVARAEPVLDKKARVLRINGWWWEAGVRPDDAMRAALRVCVREFAAYLNAGSIEVAGSAAAVRGLKTALGVRMRSGGTS